MTLDTFRIALKEQDTAIEARFDEDIQGLVGAEVWENRVLTAYEEMDASIAGLVRQRFMHFKDFFKPGGIMEGHIVLTRPTEKILYSFAPSEATVTRFSLSI